MILQPSRETFCFSLTSCCCQPARAATCKNFFVCLFFSLLCVCLVFCGIIVGFKLTKQILILWTEKKYSLMISFHPLVSLTCQAWSAQILPDSPLFTSKSFFCLSLVSPSGHFLKSQPQWFIPWRAPGEPPTGLGVGAGWQGGSRPARTQSYWSVCWTNPSWLWPSSPKRGAWGSAMNARVALPAASSAQAATRPTRPCPLSRSGPNHAIDLRVDCVRVYLVVCLTVPVFSSSALYVVSVILEVTVLHYSCF